MNTELFKRFYTGTLSRRDDKKMLHSNEITRLMDLQWEHPEEVMGKVNAPDFEELFQKIEQKTTQKNNRWQFSFYRIAAGLALLIGLTAALYYSFRNETIEQIQFATATGEIKSFTLPDGSQLWLGQNSKLSFSANFLEKRLLNMEGLAFFKVVKNNTPFKVNAGLISVEVTGTAFSISNYPDAPEIETTLVEGAVLISSKDFNQKLKPDEKIIFNKKSGKYLISNVNSRELTLWKEPELSFNNSSITDIANELKKRYGINFRVSQNAAAYNFTFSLSEETLVETLALISTLAPIEAKQSNDSIIFCLRK